ncbi:MAG: RNA polymerase factor sigma-54 [Gemmatales bacterium]|nr:RNA polymerase factor sigma-54 [Gemmatales bacterium]MDW7994032.1 RNA polymerase factor sigma-54 [Gemmatales bacterium]
MRLEATQQLALHQKMILAPRMIQSMEILQLPIMALQERIQQELEENPVLLVVEKSPALEQTPSEQPASESQEWQDELEQLEKLIEERDEERRTRHRLSPDGLEEAADRQLELMLNTPARPQSLHDYLLEQLAFLDAPPRHLSLARFLVAYLDENGYLTTPLEQLAQVYNQATGEEVSVQDMEAALRLVQQLEPRGVGARDLKECLLLQLNPDLPNLAVLRVLIEDHLEDLQHNRLPLIQKKTGFELTTIQRALAQLKQLQPRPGAAFNPETAQYVVPDLIVERDENGAYQVRLADDYLPELRISKRYLELRQHATDPKIREFLARKIQAARWLKEAIAQRKRTLLKVARAILHRQRDFLEKGPEHIVPLRMQEIADEVGVHVTTVSRAVDDKWIQTPRGLFPLRRFFGGGVTTAQGEEVAWETIRQKLLDIIAHEDKARPYSDEELVQKLREQGLPVARRTVTKYRKLLRIPSSRQRKDWTLAASHTSQQNSPPSS